MRRGLGQAEQIRRPAYERCTSGWRSVYRDERPAWSPDCTRVWRSWNLVRAFAGFSDSQLVGGPDWINAERFDIVATGGTNATPDQVRAMLQTLLADRFKLAVHTEKRTVSAFAPVMAKTVKTLGS